MLNISLREQTHEAVSELRPIYLEIKDEREKLYIQRKIGQDETVFNKNKISESFVHETIINSVRL